MSNFDKYANSKYNDSNMSEFQALSIAYTALSNDHKKLRRQLGSLMVQLKGVKDREQLMLQLMRSNDMVVKLSEEKKALENRIKYLTASNTGLYIMERSG